MLKFSKGVVKARFLILIMALVLLFPAAFGYIRTRINYDVLTYLPKDLDTMKGQDILLEQFGTGAYSMFICEDMEEKAVAAVKEKIEDVPHVNKVLWYDSFADISMPMKDIIPDKIYKAFNTDEATMMFITFDSGTSADETMEAIHEIRKVAGEQTFLAGMSAIVTDTKDLSDQEVVTYVLIAVLLSVLVLGITMDSFAIPFIFLTSIGLAIVYNLGSNIFLGQISYITKALAAVLQLGVTMDYSIFLWHSYCEQQEIRDDKKEAMAHAITATIKSVGGSSITTVAGFVALCFMSFTLGLDIGIVMVKGVIFGVASCITILPSLILVFDKLLKRTKHRTLVPEVPKFSEFIMKHYRAFAIILLLMIVPAYYCQAHTKVYYKLDDSLPESLPSVQANTKLDENFDMGATHMVLVPKSVSSKDMVKMTKEMEAVKGVKSVLCLDSIVGPLIPSEFIPSKLKDTFESDDWKMMIVLNKYATASNQVNKQCTKLETIIHKYDENALLIGEAPCTKDLIKVTNHDFAVVNTVSILLVFLIIFIVFRSLTLPIVLIMTIEFAIFINMGIPFLTGSKLPFIASIVIGTIQLGATVDYAILMTSRYELERCSGKSKYDSVWIAHRTSVKSIFVSALTFFSATFGVAMYSNISLISSLCLLMARGAIISMFVVLLILPSMLMVFDRFIIKTSRNFRRAGVKR